MIASTSDGRVHITGSFGGTPAVLSGEEMYQLLMSRIEPELTREGLLTLPEKYRSETAEQKQERIARYNNAFDLYEKELTRYGDEWNQKFKEHKRTTLQSFEHISGAAEHQNLQTIESAMNAS